MLFPKKLKIGLALGSGGIRGLAHIAVIKVLEENKIPIDFIAGSSIGALIGGFYAARKNIAEIENLLLSLTRRKILGLFFDPSLIQGLSRGKKLKKFLEGHLGQIKFSELKIPFCAVATDVKNGETVELKKGSVASSILASGSIPLVFRPQKLDDRLLIDGGFSQPVPVKSVKNMGADFIMAVNLNKDYFINNNQDRFGFYRVTNNALSILTHHLAEENIKKADFIFAPQTNHGGLVDLFINGEEKKKIINENEVLFRNLIPQLKKLITDRSKSWFSKLLGI